MDVRCLFGHCQGFFPPPQIRKPASHVVQARGQVGQESLGIFLCQLSIDVRSLPRRLQSFFPPP